MNIRNHITIKSYISLQQQNIIFDRALMVRLYRIYSFVIVMLVISIIKSNLKDWSFLHPLLSVLLIPIMWGRRLNSVCQGMQRADWSRSLSSLLFVLFHCFLLNRGEWCPIVFRCWWNYDFLLDNREREIMIARLLYIQKNKRFHISFCYAINKQQKR